MIQAEYMKYFTDHTMSVHLKRGLPPMAKQGVPGRVRLVDLEYPDMEEDDLTDIIMDIEEEVRYNDHAFLEVEEDGFKVYQLEDLRITITRPPVSEATEITIVRPIKHLRLEEYHISPKLYERLRYDAHGILIAGAPGAGKSTFAEALANFYAEAGKIVKTMEHPRDLQVDKKVTQYAPIEGDMSKLADVLLLVRPDYTIFDEVRRTDDFHAFADLRLAGIGMVGVTHATKAIDAIQRLTSRMELFVIPSVVDTVIFIEDGFIGAIYELKMTVKVPYGMREQDLARPVIEVKENNKPVYEIYTYGEQTVIMEL